MFIELNIKESSNFKWKEKKSLIVVIRLIFGFLLGLYSVGQVFSNVGCVQEAQF